MPTVYWRTIICCELACRVEKLIIYSVVTNKLGEAVGCLAFNKLKKEVSRKSNDRAKVATCWEAFSNLNQELRADFNIITEIIHQESKFMATNRLRKLLPYTFEN